MEGEGVEEIKQEELKIEEIPISTEENEVELEGIELDRLKGYINCLDTWGFDGEVPNFSFLGDVIEALTYAKFPPEKPAAFPPGPHYLPIKICILGSLFSGRHTYAKYLEGKYGLKFFEIEKILEDRNKVLERKQEIEEGKKPKKPQEDESEIFVEEAVANAGDSCNDKARLVRAKLRGVLGDEPKVEEEVKKTTKKDEVKCQGWGLISFPKTAEEAEELESELSGFIDDRHLPPSKAYLKLQASHIIAKPSGLTQRRPVLHKSAFDLIFKLEVPAHILIKRAIDRRVDASGNVYNLTFNPPPDNLLPKLKPIEHPNEEEILRSLEEFNSEKSALASWLQKFGIENWSSFVNINETKLDLVKEIIEKKVQEWLKIREELSGRVESDEVLVEFRAVEGFVKKVEVKEMYFEWVTLKNLYLKELTEALESIRGIKHDVKDAKFGILSRFEDFLIRDDHKQTLVDPFLEKLKSLLESRAIITSRSRKNMLDELDNLSDSLWDIIEGRKEENIKYFDKLRSQDPSQTLLIKMLQSTELLIKTEMNKLVRSTALIHKFLSTLTPSESFEALDFGEIELNCDEADGETRMNKMIAKARRFIESLAENEYVEEAKAHYLSRVQQIETWGNRTLRNILEISSHIFKVMDVWIGDAVRAENEFVNEIIEAWKRSVNTRIVSEHMLIKGNENIRMFLTREEQSAMIF